jgi:hypothetical protein
MHDPRGRPWSIQRRQQVRARLKPQRLLRDLASYYDRRPRPTRTWSTVVDITLTLLG